MQKQTKNADNNLQSSNEGYHPLSRNIGAQAPNNDGQKGYTPRPDGNFGYRPKKQSPGSIATPTSGSNIVRPKNNNPNNINR